MEINTERKLRGDLDAAPFFFNLSYRISPTSITCSRVTQKKIVDHFYHQGSYFILVLPFLSVH